MKKRQRLVVCSVVLFTSAMVFQLCLIYSKEHLLKWHWNDVSNNTEKERPASEDEILVRLKGPLQPDDPDLIRLIKERYLVPPSDKPYNLRYRNHKMLNLSWIFIKSILEDFFSTKTGGFFVEAGAFDGEYMSNTLALEQDQRWTGLLVEPDPGNYAELLERHRKAWVTPTCLATNDYPQQVVLKRDAFPMFGPNKLNRGTGKIVRDTDMAAEQTLYNSVLSSAQCVPLASLLAALNVSHVDFFVLDVEQVEEEVLRYFPFHEIHVDLWAIEHFTQGEDQKFAEFMIDKGYYYFDRLCAAVADYIFVRKASALFDMLSVPKEQQNRTEICANKYFQLPSAVDITLSAVRDRHHYPNFKFVS